MKKTYISPELLSVTLNVRTHILDGSLPINTGGGDDNTIGDAGEILTKENKNVNVWDEEW